MWERFSYASVCNAINCLRNLKIGVWKFAGLLLVCMANVNLQVSDDRSTSMGISSEKNQSGYLKLFLSYQDDFMAYLYSLTGNRDACLDIFQNSAVAIMEQGSLDHVENFRAWSKEIVRRQALYFLRTEAGQKMRCRAISPDLLDAISEVFVREDTENDASDNTDRMAHCVDKLPDTQKNLINLRYGKNLSFQQVAEAVESTSGAVQRSISRIRNRLRRCVQQKLAEGT